MGVLFCFVCLFYAPFQQYFSYVCYAVSFLAIPGRTSTLDSFPPRQTTKESLGENGNLKYFNCI